MNTCNKKHYQQIVILSLPCVSIVSHSYQLKQFICPKDKNILKGKNYGLE